MLYYVFHFFYIYPSIILNAQEKDNYTIAVFDLSAEGISESETRILTNELRFQISRIINSSEYKNLQNTVNYEIIERSEIEKILDEYNFESTGCVSDSCAIELGQMLQLDRMILGTVGLIGETYSASIRMVDVKTAKTIDIANRNITGKIDEVLKNIIPNLAKDLLIIEETQFQETPISIQKVKKDKQYESFLRHEFGISSLYGLPISGNRKLLYRNGYGFTLQYHYSINMNSKIGIDYTFINSDERIETSIMYAYQKNYLQLVDISYKYLIKRNRRFQPYINIGFGLAHFNHKRDYLTFTNSIVNCVIGSGILLPLLYFEKSEISLDLNANYSYIDTIALGWDKEEINYLRFHAGIIIER